MPGLEIDSFHVSATSRLALRSRNVNVSMTTGTEVCSFAPASPLKSDLRALWGSARLVSSP